MKIYHIYNRGVLKLPIFKQTEDYIFFLLKMAQAKRKTNIAIHAYCLMPNHFHLLIRDNQKKTSRFLQILQGGYAKYLNGKYKTSGHVFQNTYRSKEIKDEIYYRCILSYIEKNPVKDKLVATSKEWPFSSVNNIFK